jgi:Cof subfamily protein (haloacid dehalogenase superfamily)
MKIKKLIAIDMDGTLLLEDNNTLGEYSAKVLSYLNKNGYMVVLASGRPYRSMKRYYDRISCKGPMICYNGTQVFSPCDPTFPTYYNPFKKEVVLSIYREVKDRLSSFMCESNTDIYAIKEDKYLDTYFPFSDMNIHIGNIEEDLDEDVMTCLFEAKEEDSELLKELAEAHPTIGWRHWHYVDYSELYKIGRNKGSALHYIAEVLGVKKEDIISFGDSNNDLEMLQEAGTAFCMKGGKGEALPKLFPTTEKGNAQEGVAHQLVKLLNLTI